jgi:hypothetical protein
MWAMSCPCKTNDEVVIAWSLAMYKIGLLITLQQLKMKVIKNLKL